YTRRGEDVAERLAALEASLALDTGAQAPYREQSPDDGSWGGSMREWFLRLHATVDPLRELLRDGGRPRHRLSILDAVDTPQKIVAHFEQLIVSRPLGDGVDRRKELNLTVTALGQLLFLPELADAFEPGWPRAEVAAALAAFMDDHWQDRETG